MRGLEPPNNRSLYSPSTNLPTWGGGNYTTSNKEHELQKLYYS